MSVPAAQAAPKAPRGFESGLVDVTPSMAMKALESRHTNRNAKLRAIRRYAADMLEDRWDPYNGETVKFRDGRLVDGLQRMSAVALAGETNPDIVVTFLVVNGVSEKSNLTTDAGVPRSFGDWLRLEGDIPASPTVAASVNRMYGWDILRVFASNMSMSVSYPVLDGYWKEHRGEILEAAETSLDNREVRKLMTPSVYLTIRVILNRIDPERSTRFLEQLVSGADLPKDSPVLTLRERLLADRKGMMRGRQGKNALRYPPQEVARALTFIAWNLEGEGRTTGRLVLPKGDLQANYPLPR